MATAKKVAKKVSDYHSALMSINAVLTRKQKSQWNELRYEMYILIDTLRDHARVSDDLRVSKNAHRLFDMISSMPIFDISEKRRGR